jgi:sulfur carrier protein
MQVSVNGEMKTLPQGCSVKEMLKLLNFHNEWLGVAVNREFVPKDAFEETLLKEGDEVDVLAPVSGG